MTVSQNFFESYYPNDWTHSVHSSHHSFIFPLSRSCKVGSSFFADTVCALCRWFVFTVPKNKTTLTLFFRHLNCCTNVLVRDQTGITQLKREKADFIILQQTESLLQYFLVNQGFRATAWFTGRRGAFCRGVAEDGGSGYISLRGKKERIL